VTLIGPTVIGPGCDIDEGSVVENSILWSNVHVSQNVKIKNCIIADKNVIEKNASLENQVVNKID
jgi:NDP-sugar pyrophosphorylase family protein